jgi:hypothetical protein
MVVYIVCFDLSVPSAEQQEQIEYWMDFLSSSLPFPSNPSQQNTKWSIILAGLRADRQVPFVLKTGPTVEKLSSWKTHWPHLPISRQWFVISSTTSRESVQHLLKFLNGECDRIFKTHAIQIPSSYRALLHEIQRHKDYESLKSVSSLFERHPCGMTETNFQQALQYLHAIGRLVCLKNGLVCTDPTLVPKIAAKFVAPENVRHYLLSIAEIGCILEIPEGEDEKYPNCFTPLVFNVTSLFCFCFCFCF